MANGQRYLYICFKDDEQTGIWFLQAASSEQKNKVGKQTAGQPILVIYTDNMKELYNHVKANGIIIIEEPASFLESKFFYCLDLYGNRLTVAEL
jgi:predicted enzyme related to lactoylglutathione lyase